MAVHWLLAYRARSADAFVPLWCLGYDVSLGEVRHGLLRLVDRSLAPLSASPERPRDMAEVLDHLREKEDYRLRRRKSDTPPPHLAELYVTSRFNPRRQPDARLIEAAARELAAKGPVSPVGEVAALVTKGAEFIRHHLSLPRCREVVAVAGEVELQRVQTQLGSLLRFFRAFPSDLPDDGESVLLLAAGIGPVLAVLLLALGQAPFAAEITALILGLPHASAEPIVVVDTSAG